MPLEFDYLTINFTAVSGLLFLLIFLYANSSLDAKIKRTFYGLILMEFVEMAVYSLELWTSTFETLSPMRLWFSALGYSLRPFIFCLILKLVMRNSAHSKVMLLLYLPATINVAAAFSVFSADMVYSYTPDNLFQRGPMGFFTHAVLVLYLVALMIIVVRSQTNRPKLEILIIFAICLLLIFGMLIEAVYSIRTIGRSSIVLVTIFYYMFFQTQVYRASMEKEQDMRLQLEHASRIDGSTGVLNKKAFTETARALFAQDGQQKTAVGFIFLDLDHLKQLNDTLGHSVGDIAIADTAQIIQSVCRKTDLTGRFGGDEFCIALMGIPRQRFRTFLDEVQEKMRREYSRGETTVRVSASMGAIYTEDAQQAGYERIVSLADEALYEAKASGRDCHVIKEL